MHLTYFQSLLKGIDCKCCSSQAGFYMDDIYIYLHCIIGI